MDDEAEAEEAESPALEDGDSVEVEGSSSTYTLTRHGNVYMCTCPAWRNQSLGVDLRTCKHLRAYLGDEHEAVRCGATSASRAATVVRSSGGGGGSSGGRAVKKETAPPVLLAHKWEVDHDPTGWWMSEKLDGIRAYWDGETFVSRNGNVFYAPDWFTTDLPADTLDGELWVGRKMFNKTTSIVRAGAANAEWRSVQYVIFDAPNAKGGFEDRIAHAKKVIERAGAPHARVLEHDPCAGFAHLREELRRIEGLGGEGLMLRRPGSKYEVGRSQTLLKVKTFHDAEARVVGHSPGTGRHKGRLGALICELPSGIQFNVGTGFKDAERENPVKIGAVITFRYQELTEDGVPRFPAWVGERIDVDLPEEVEEAEEEAAPPPKTKKAGAAAPAAKPKAKAPPPPPPDEEAEEQEEAADDDGPYAKYGAVAWRQSLVNDDEDKFWKIEVRGTHHFATFGKNGSPGQVRLSNLGVASAAKSDAEKRAMQKRKEGYRIVK
ncbi:MAG: DNA ligase [Deltaproteobacteria bacterium]|nr:DNA ligase [Deltaproteobacteria bacterium]